VERDGREASAPGLAGLRIAQGRRSYQRSDVEAAAVLLRRAVTIAELHPRPTVLFLGLLYLADAELACGDRSTALAALARAREIVDDEPVSAYAARRLEEAEAGLGRAGTRAAKRSGALAEELTDRELSLLRALQGPATRREIGAAQYLSINTVKAYNKSLYRKLGVASRHDAVAAARDLGLI
jgi:LuxR family maltose regulon positive regulatory protein